MQYRCVKGHNSIISYSSLKNTIKTSNIAYPHEIEKEIVNAIKSKIQMQLLLPQRNL